MPIHIDENSSAVTQKLRNAESYIVAWKVLAVDKVLAAGGEALISPFSLEILDNGQPMALRQVFATCQWNQAFIGDIWTPLPEDYVHDFHNPCGIHVWRFEIDANYQVRSRQDQTGYKHVCCKVRIEPQDILVANYEEIVARKIFLY